MELALKINTTLSVEKQKDAMLSYFKSLWPDHILDLDRNDPTVFAFYKTQDTLDLVKDFVKRSAEDMVTNIDDYPSKDVVFILFNDDYLALYHVDLDEEDIKNYLYHLEVDNG